MWMTKTKFEKNASDSTRSFTDIKKLAQHVQAEEAAGGDVQVYRCVPIEHEIYTQQVAIRLGDDA